MSIRPTDVKEPIYEQTGEANMTESEKKKAQVKKTCYFMILFMAIDLIITICVILHESNIFTKLVDNNYLYLIINISCFVAFILFVLISLLLYKVCLAKVVKYLYIILLGGYFIYLLVMKIIYFVKYNKILVALDYVFLVIKIKIIF